MARILVVEDESVAAWYLQEALENLGHQVVANAMSGEEALQEAGETQPDLVLMDIRLQGDIDGIAAAQQIRSRFDIPVVYLTAHADDSTLKRAIATNPFGYLVKPFQEREVHTTIEIALRRHQLEKHSEDTKQWFVNTFDSIDNATIATNRDGNIIFMNPAAEALTGWSQQEVIGKAATTVVKIIDVATLNEIENPLLQVMREGAPLSLPQDCLLLTKDGMEVPIADTASPIRNNSGEIIGSVLVFQDVTLHQEARSEIEERNFTLELREISLVAQLQERTVQLQQALACIQLLKDVMERVPESSTQIQTLQTIISQLGRVLKADYCCVALYSINHILATISCEHIADEALNHCPSGLGVQIDMQRFPDFYRPLLQREYWLSPPLEFLPAPYQVLLKSDGQILSCPLFDGELVIGEVTLLSTDNAPWSQLQAELISQVISQCTVVLRQAHSYKSAQEEIRDEKVLNRLKDHFVSVVSRDLFTPIANMRMAVELLSSLVTSLQRADQETETPLNRQPFWQQLEHYLQVLREEWQQESNLIGDLLNFQNLNLETLSEPLPFYPIDFQQWLPKLVNRFWEPSVRQRQVLSCQVSLELPSIVSHEPSLERIVTELLANACKFSPPDSRIAVTAQGEGEKVVIKVTNTGVTIAPEEFNRIFEPFYQIPNPSRLNGGTGLGLALVKKLVQLLNGDIQVHSVADETTFTVTLFQEQLRLES